MITTNINNIDGKKRVLIAPLDWGLGHATRCVPIITAFLKQGYEVFAAGEKAIALLLQQEFPSIQILPLAGYNIQYSKNKKGFAFKMLTQIPSILKSINRENIWLQNCIEQYKIDIVVSDNRYGLHSKKATTIFITHQLHIQTGNSFLDKIVQRINYKYINKFDSCWVPDIEGSFSLADALSHPTVLPKTNVKYVGILSRVQKYNVDKLIDVAVILSGPEPQRTIFENIIFKQIENSNLKIVVARGILDNVDATIFTNKNITVINHLPSGEISKLIQAAKTVVARSGYSTIMDIATLQQPAIFVPTLGQTEQMYLAKYLSEKNYCTATSQHSFDLHAEVEKISKLKLENYPSNNAALLEAAIADL